jgi:hypothetical protein
LARNTAEVEFLTIGDGARLWLSEAAAAGTTKIRVKMAQAVTLAKLFETKDVDWALGHAAVHARFAEADLASILDHHRSTSTTAAAAVSRAGEDGSLTQGTASWGALGASPAPPAATAATAATASPRGVLDDDGAVSQSGPEVAW